MEMSGQLHAPAALPPRKSPGTHWIGGWVGPRSSLELQSKEKSFAPAGNQTPTIQLIAHCYTDWGMQMITTPTYLGTTQYHTNTHAAAQINPKKETSNNAV
jgi:hypothetical protein